MKKIAIFLYMAMAFNGFSQVSTLPAVPTASDEISLTFDTTGTGLEGYNGAVYAHTGVTINGERWQQVLGSWNQNDTQPELTQDSEHPQLYHLVISPDVYTFYGVDTADTINELCLVFRSANGSQQTTDIFVPIYEEGLNIIFSQPLNNAVFNLNESTVIQAETSVSANLEILAEDNSLQTSDQANSISANYTFVQTGPHQFTARASTDEETVEAQLSVYVKTPTQTAPKPAGIEYGINKNTDNSITFLLKAPNKKEVFVIGDFNQWDLQAAYQMKKDGDDFWLTLSGLDPDTEYAYQYLIDYELRVADPYSEKILDPWTDEHIKPGNYPDLKAYPTGETTGYVSTFLINEVAYPWTTTNFVRPAPEKLVIYELLLRDFTDSDSYNEALTKLDYLAELGVNAIELMPVNEFEGVDSWGYNPALYFALDKSYGRKNDLKRLVDACHERGMAVLVDVVFNHSYGQSPLAQMYWDAVQNQPAADNPWYNQQHNFVDNTASHWGNDFNHESPHTVAFFEDVLNYWMSEYKIDGFRFDFTKGFSNTIYSGPDNWGSDYDTSRINILKNYADSVWGFSPDNKPYVIFEHLADNAEETELADYGILLWGNMNHAYNQNTMGYSENADLSWISYQERGWDKPGLVGYMESHDEERLMYNNLQHGNSHEHYHVQELPTALSRQALAGAFFFGIPGPKMVWQFGELGYEISINENGRLGRKPLHWEYVDQPQRKHIYDTWATLIAFKKQAPVFSTDDYSLDLGGLTKSIVLRHDSMDLVIVGNFDVETRTISPPFSHTGTWYEYFSGEERTVTGNSTSISLLPGEYRLYANQRLLDPRGGSSTDDSDHDGVVDTEDLCPNTMEGTSVNSTGCPVFRLPENNFSLEATGESCAGIGNGQLVITANESHDYVATINGINHYFSTSITLSNLAPGTYDCCIGVSDEDYEQCFRFEIEAGSSLAGKTRLSAGHMTIDIESGTPPFTIAVNGVQKKSTNLQNMDIDVQQGDLVEVRSSKTCEGVLSSTVGPLREIVAYPNPTSGLIHLEIPSEETEVVVQIFTSQGVLVQSRVVKIVQGKISLHIENLPKSLYLAHLLAKETYFLQIIKN